MNLKTIAAATLMWAGVSGLMLAGENIPSGKSATNSPAAATATPAKVAAPAREAQKSTAFTVLGYLEKRDRVITIKSGPQGVVYSVATKDGKVLFENLSSAQLRAQAPEIHQLIKTGVGGDARVRVSAIQ